MSKYGVFSGPYFPAFEMNTGKYRLEKTPYLDTLHAGFISKYNEKESWHMHSRGLETFEHLNIFFNLATIVTLYELVKLYTRLINKREKSFVSYYRLRKQMAFHESFQASEMK